MWEKKQDWSGKGHGRHLQQVSEGRRLKSAFDVFDFVNNAISSGVKEAKRSTDNALKKFGKDVKSLVNKGEKEVSKEADKIINDEDVKSVVNKANDGLKDFLNDAKKTIDNAVHDVIERVEENRKNDKEAAAETPIAEAPVEVTPAEEAPVNVEIVEEPVAVEEATPSEHVLQTASPVVAVEEEEVAPIEEVVVEESA